MGGLLSVHFPGLGGGRTIIMSDGARTFLSSDRLLVDVTTTRSQPAATESSPLLLQNTVSTSREPLPKPYSTYLVETVIDSSVVPPPYLRLSGLFTATTFLAMCCVAQTPLLQPDEQLICLTKWARGNPGGVASKTSITQVGESLRSQRHNRRAPLAIGGDLTGGQHVGEPRISHKKL